MQLFAPLFPLTNFPLCEHWHHRYSGDCEIAAVASAAAAAAGKSVLFNHTSLMGSIQTLKMNSC